MRDLKFRAWDGVSYMSNPFTLQDIQLRKIAFTSGCPVMQFTGLTDKNKNEIYEGDITHSAGGREYYEIIWNKSGWKIKSVTSHKVILYSAEMAKFQIVVGNIYEHPNLTLPS